MHGHSAAKFVREVTICEFLGSKTKILDTILSLRYINFWEYLESRAIQRNSPALAIFCWVPLAPHAFHDCKHAEVAKLLLENVSTH